MQKETIDLLIETQADLAHIYDKIDLILETETERQVFLEEEMKKFSMGFAYVAPENKEPI